VQLAILHPHQEFHPGQERNLDVLFVTLPCERMCYSVQFPITCSTSLSKYSLMERIKPLIEGTIFEDMFWRGKGRVGEMS
jgi:hypothetical protein